MRQMDYAHNLWAMWFKTRREDLDIVSFLLVDSRRSLNLVQDSLETGQATAWNMRSSSPLAESIFHLFMETRYEFS